jgi:hypothetical protein
MSRQSKMARKVAQRRENTAARKARKTKRADKNS